MVQTADAHALRNPLKPFDDSRQHVDEPVDVGLGRRPADRDPQRMIGVDAHRLEHRRRFQHLRRARRTRVHRDAVLVERQQDRFGLDAVDADAQRGAGASPPASDRRTARRRGSSSTTVAAASRSSARWRAASRRERRRRRTRRRSRPTRERPRCRRAAPAPARRRRASGGTRSPRRTSSAPAPFGPPELVRGHRTEVGAERRERRRARDRSPRTRRRGRARRASRAARTPRRRAAPCRLRGSRAAR